MHIYFELNTRQLKQYVYINWMFYPYTFINELTQTQTLTFTSVQVYRSNDLLSIPILQK